LSVPQYNADGDVIDIALHTIKIQNWDKTISVIPTHKLIEGTFKNWRGMQESGGRRRLTEIKEYNTKNKIDTSEIVNGRNLTNVGVFRRYILEYLSNHPHVKKDMTFLIRQLAPGSTGLPIEIYVFSDDIEWVNYEAIQADIFDHILAVVPQFGLKVFQYPTGGFVIPDALKKS